MFFWLLFANLSVLGKLVYSTSFKLSGDNINAYAFTLIMSCVQLVSLSLAYLFARYVLHVDIVGEIKSRGVVFAVLGGLAVTLLDVSYFFAFRHGSAAMTNTYCNVANTVLFLGLSLVLFGEKLTLAKGAGVLLGLVSLVLVSM